jgi:hypothetical protein
MITIAIALGVLAWVIIVVTCLALARSAALDDAMLLRRNRQPDGRRTRRAA